MELEVIPLTHHNKVDGEVASEESVGAIGTVFQEKDRGNGGVWANKWQGKTKQILRSYIGP